MGITSDKIEISNLTKLYGKTVGIKDLSLNIKQGEIFTEQNIVAKRTGGKGISPIHFEQLLGKKATKDYSPNEIIYE